MPLIDLEHAVSLLENGRAAEAVRLLRETSDELPPYASARVLLAQAYEELEEWDHALAAWREAHHLVPNSPVVRRGLHRVARRAYSDTAVDPDAVPPDIAESSPLGAQLPRREPDAVNGGTGAFEPDVPQAPVDDWDSTQEHDARVAETQPPHERDADIPEQLQQPADLDAGQPEQRQQPAEPDAGFSEQRHHPSESDAGFYEQRQEPRESDTGRPEQPQHPTASDARLPDHGAPAEFDERRTEPQPPQGFGTESVQPTPAEPEPGPPPDDPKIPPPEPESGTGPEPEGPPTPEPNRPPSPDEPGYLDWLINEIDSARIIPRPDIDAVPPPELDDDIEDVVSETLARIYASQGQYDEAARVYELLAGQHPEDAPDFMRKASEMRSRASGGD